MNQGNNHQTQEPDLTKTRRTRPVNYRNGDGQLPPHNEEAEWFLLACLIVKPSVIPAIDPETFYIVAASECYAAMSEACKLRLFCTDYPHAFAHYVGRRLANAASSAKLNKAIAELPSAENWPYWHGVVMDCYKARCLEQLKPKISEIAEQVSRGGRPDEVLFEIQKISRLWHGARSKTVAELMPEVQAFLEYAHLHPGQYPGVSTGFSRFDWLVCGLQAGKQYVIGGRPGNGKTSLVACMAVGLARRGIPVGLISLEMLGPEITARMVSSESRVPLVNFTRDNATDEQTQLAARMMAEINALPITIADQLRTLPEIIMAMHEQAAAGAKVIFVDYLQKIIINRFRGNRNELVTEISGTMKELSIGLKLPVVCCAQLNRESEKQEREPTNADLRDSGAIEQDADFVGLLHSKGRMTDPEYGGACATDMIVTKNRSGEETRLALAFQKEIFRFEEL